MQLGGCADFYVLVFRLMYLTWSDLEMDLTKEQPVPIKFWANLGRTAMETLHSTSPEITDG
jgi:hypothetical protein